MSRFWSVFEVPSPRPKFHLCWQTTLQLTKELDFNSALQLQFVSGLWICSGGFHVLFRVISKPRGAASCMEALRDLLEKQHWSIDQFFSLGTQSAADWAAVQCSHLRAAPHNSSEWEVKNSSSWKEKWCPLLYRDQWCLVHWIIA